MASAKDGTANFAGWLCKKAECGAPNSRQHKKNYPLDRGYTAGVAPFSSAYLPQAGPERLAMIRDMLASAAAEDERDKRAVKGGVQTMKRLNRTQRRAAERAAKSSAQESRIKTSEEETENKSPENGPHEASEHEDDEMMSCSSGPSPE